MTYSLTEQRQVQKNSTQSNNKLILLMMIDNLLIYLDWFSTSATFVIINIKESNGKAVLTCIWMYSFLVVNSC